MGAGPASCSWLPPPPFFGLFEGFAGDGLLGSFNAEVLWRQVSVNGHVTGLEAMYEVVDGDRSFTALIRGGSNPAGLGHARRRHHGWVANRRAGAGRLSEVSPQRRGLRGGTRRTRIVSRESSTSGAPQGTERAARACERHAAHPVAGLLTEQPSTSDHANLRTALMQGDAKEIALRVCPGEEVG